MLRLKHISGSLEGRTSSCSKQSMRIGRADDCDIKFDKLKDPQVSSHHAEIVLEDGAWVIIDTASTNGTLVNGRKVAKRTLRPGDKLQLGAGGPVATVEFDAPASKAAPTDNRTQMVQVSDLESQEKRFDDTEELSSIASHLKKSADTQTASLAELAAKKVAMARQQSGGQSSGQTMMIMADTLRQVQQGTKAKTKKRWVRVVAVVASVAAVVVLGLGVVIWQQKRQLDALVAEKNKVDKDIVAIEQQMENEQDPDKLAELEARLDALSGKAQTTIAELGKKNKEKAKEVVEAGDDLDKEIRRILKAFSATTYAVPPVFKERLQFHVDELARSSNRKFIYKRKQKYWPMILQAFEERGLPEEMAYIAWAESQFDPKAKSGAGAAGMWQLGESTAKNYKLRVEKKGVDERLDPEKSTKAAARYLANLLSEFGEDSFMLAMASYNKGESGVRRVLHKIAEEKGGFKKEKRDFWHLYRLKKLPEETREYVPKILAAAVVCHNPGKFGME